MKTAKPTTTSKGKVVSVHATTSSETQKRKLTQVHAQPEEVDSTKPAITHDMIAQRARAIWMAKGCRSGQDEQNWYEAERQLHIETMSELE